jgi:hypothetical protein
MKLVKKNYFFKILFAYLRQKPFYANEISKNFYRILKNYEIPTSTKNLG